MFSLDFFQSRRRELAKLFVTFKLVSSRTCVTTLGSAFQPNARCCRVLEFEKDTQQEEHRQIAETLAQVRNLHRNVGTTLIQAQVCATFWTGSATACPDQSRAFTLPIAQTSLAKQIVTTRCFNDLLKKIAAYRTLQKLLEAV